MSKTRTENINGISFTFELVKVDHGSLRPPTMEWVCIDCRSYMKHTGITTQDYHCNSCGHSAARVSHVGFNSNNEIITRLTKTAGTDIRKHAASNCEFVKLALSKKK